jgi:ADP-dependent NAD(P)H-hydrate dehydratase / NAD(P)H-hydrate epimerase
MYLVDAKQMREMDRRTIEAYGLDGRILMENAGRGATRFFCDRIDRIGAKRVAIVAGRGNNGGDGFVIARYLAQKKIRATVFLLADAARLSGDALANFNLLAPIKVPVIAIIDEKAFSKYKSTLLHQDVFVDAILGTGLNSDVKGFFKKIIDFINQSAKPVLAVDIPSGLNADTGQICGVCIKAFATATFGFAKIGHMLEPGAELTGKLKVVDIGIPNFVAEAVDPRVRLTTSNQVADALPKRANAAHKGDTGHLFVVAGSTGKTGAAIMATNAALRSGAGLVTLGVAAGLNPILENQVIEAMTLPLPEVAAGTLGTSALKPILESLEGKRCLALGPGMGTAPETVVIVTQIVQKCPVPLVIDADGLNCLVGQTEVLKNAKVPIVLTPHPGEMARLAGVDTKTIGKDRVAFARTWAQKLGVCLVLKGARTVVAQADGSVFINPTGNAGMATGGMGDVLTGVIAGLITQGFEPEVAARAGVYLHGLAADILAESVGPVGYLATEVMQAIPKARTVVTELIDGRPQ